MRKSLRNIIGASTLLFTAMGAEAYHYHHLAKRTEHSTYHHFATLCDDPRPDVHYSGNPIIIGCIEQREEALASLRPLMKTLRGLEKALREYEQHKGAVFCTPKELSI